MVDDHITRAEWESLCERIEAYSRELKEIRRLLSGGERMGFLSKVQIMWQVWVWGLPLVSFVLGAALIEVVKALT